MRRKRQSGKIIKLEIETPIFKYCGKVFESAAMRILINTKRNYKKYYLGKMPQQKDYLRHYNWRTGSWTAPPPITYAEAIEKYLKRSREGYIKVKITHISEQYCNWDISYTVRGSDEVYKVQFIGCNESDAKENFRKFYNKKHIIKKINKSK